MAAQTSYPYIGAITPKSGGTGQTSYPYIGAMTPLEVVAGFNVDIKVAGAWKSVASCMIKVGGVWKTVSSIKTMVDGVWKA